LNNTSAGQVVGFRLYDMFGKLLHKYLRIPYRLAVRYDSKRGSEVVVFLHGVAASGDVWRPIYEDKVPQRYVMIDLLGFGDSPKPDFMDYTAEEHARSILYTLNRMGIDSFTLVGHSMGALIALHLAANFPERVRALVCVSMPVYDMSEGKKKALIRYRTNAYVMLYTAMIEHPMLTWGATQAIVHSFGSKTGLTLDKKSVVPFQRSLRNTIIHQHALEQLSAVAVPTTVLYGHFDPFVIADYFLEDDTNAHVEYVKTEATHILDKKLIFAVRDRLRKVLATNSEGR